MFPGPSFRPPCRRLRRGHRDHPGAGGHRNDSGNGRHRKPGRYLKNFSRDLDKCLKAFRKLLGDLTDATRNERFVALGHMRGEAANLRAITAKRVMAITYTT